MVAMVAEYVIRFQIGCAATEKANIEISLRNKKLFGNGWSKVPKDIREMFSSFAAFYLKMTYYVKIS